jgi:dTDP-4-amino-4,6-dideoxygalactose transaminase
MRLAGMIEITRPFLPPREDFDRLLDEIWSRNWLTNNGPLVTKLELMLKEYLGVDYLLVVANGTLALQIALKALEIRGEVITTPFSYVASTSALVWEGLTPCYVDIDPLTLNLDPARIEAAITERTTAILPVHVYGNPCDVAAISEIATRHRLNVVYDAAHAFGTTVNGLSVLRHGDVSCLSFHATKVFHTIEGGAVVTRTPELLERAAYMRNFGHDGPFRFNGVGINAKLSEFHAAMGICNLAHANAVLERRRELSELYDEWLLPAGLTRPQVRPGSAPNCAYYAVLFPSEVQLNAALKKLELARIQPRRYFYPILSRLDYVKAPDLPIAEDSSRRVLCLPLLHDLTAHDIDLICGIIITSLRQVER